MPYPSNRAEIGQRLWEQLESARVEHQTANAHFDLLIRESPSGLPHPDGSLRIRQAGSESKAALERYMRALKRFTDFTLNGTIPEDLLPPTPG